MNNEMPEFASSTYNSTSLPLDGAVMVGRDDMGGAAGVANFTGVAARRVHMLAPTIAGSQAHAQLQQQLQPQQEFHNMAIIPHRLVQVFIADTNEHVPLDDCLLYRGEQQMTDLTDQELFYELPIKDLLDAHNAKRITMVDKSVKERVQHLKPARIRDLKMVVVNIAQF